jgi:hypothetical protein
MKKRYGSLAEKQKAYRERKAEKEAKHRSGYDEEGKLILVRYDCGKCGKWWSGSKFYDGSCPYCKAGEIKGELADVEVKYVGPALDPEPVERPSEASDSEWEMCLERAERARRYALAMPDHVRFGEEVFQDPVWQWENTVRRKGGIGRK